MGDVDWDNCVPNGKPIHHKIPPDTLDIKFINVMRTKMETLFVTLKFSFPSQSICGVCPSRQCCGGLQIPPFKKITPPLIINQAHLIWQYNSFDAFNAKNHYTIRQYQVHST